MNLRVVIFWLVIAISTNLFAQGGAYVSINGKLHYLQSPDSDIGEIFKGIKQDSIKTLNFYNVRKFHTVKYSKLNRLFHITIKFDSLFAIKDFIVENSPVQEVLIFGLQANRILLRNCSSLNFFSLVNGNIENELTISPANKLSSAHISKCTFGNNFKAKIKAPVLVKLVFSYNKFISLPSFIVESPQLSHIDISMKEYPDNFDFDILIRKRGMGILDINKAALSKTKIAELTDLANRCRVQLM